MTDTVPAADTGLLKASPDDFDADDSGAKEHRIPHDPYDAFVSALKLLLAPLSTSAISRRSKSTT